MTNLCLTPGRRLHLAALLLAVLVVAGTAHAMPPQALFAGGETLVPFEEEDGTITMKAPASFRTPALVEVDGAVLAVATVLYNSGVDESFIEVVSRLSIDGGVTWNMQIAIKNKRASYKYSRVMDPTVVVKGKKVYVLVGSWNETTGNWAEQENGDDWDALVAVGEIHRETKDGQMVAEMKWNKPISVAYALSRMIGGAKSSQFLGGVGNGLLMKNGTIVFPVQASNVEHQVAVTILYSTDDGATWKFGTGTTAIGCTESNVVEWDGKLIMNSRRDDGFRMVHESADMGATWTESSLSHVWGNSPDRTGPGSQSSFITATIKGHEAMLLSSPRNTRGNWDRNRLLLWLTNGDRVAEIGQISEGDVRTGYSSIAYINGTIHALHEGPPKNPHDGNRSVHLRSVPELTRKVEVILEQWAAQDRLLVSAGVPTNGLAGLLSDRADGETWRDSYGCVDAEATNGRSVSNGMQFTGGRFGGAQWPVVRQGQFQRYAFTRRRFTLAAAITIDEMTARNWNSPLGAALDESGEAKVLGLRYAVDGLWNPVYGYMYDRLTGHVEERREYHVALVFDDGVGRVYVDGKALDGAPKKLRYIGASAADIGHLYIGGYGNGELDRDCRSTVRNVMLYNRVLSDAEITALYMNHGKIRQAPALPAML